MDKMKLVLCLLREICGWREAQAGDKILQEENENERMHRRGKAYAYNDVGNLIQDLLNEKYGK